MKSPLKYDEAIVNEFGLKAASELSSEYKLGFARTQLEEIKKFLFRERVELLLAEGQAEGDVEALVAKAKGDIATHRNNIKGIGLSIGTLEKFVDELEATVTE